MKKLLIIFCIFVFGINSFSQIQTERPNPKSADQLRRENLDARLRKMREMENRKPSENSYPTETPLTREERNKMNLFIKINEDDKNKYKSFLKQSNTGIFRLLPDFECETQKVVRVDGKCKNFVPGIWTYSFKTKNYSSGFFHDLSYVGNDLMSDGFLSQGILVSLGDKPLDLISLDSPALSFLINFTPADKLQIISEQYQKISEGIEQNGFIYTNKVKMEENAAYALRVIAYEYKDQWKSRLWENNIQKAGEEERKFAALDYDKRNDSIYVFKIIRKSEDGGITIVWKRLSKENSPKIVYAKDERLADFKSEN